MAVTSPGRSTWLALLCAGVPPTPPPRLQGALASAREQHHCKGQPKLFQGHCGPHPWPRGLSGPPCPQRPCPREGFGYDQASHKDPQLRHKTSAEGAWPGPVPPCAEAEADQRGLQACPGLPGLSEPRMESTQPSAFPTHPTSLRQRAAQGAIKDSRGVLRQAG